MFIPGSLERYIKFFIFLLHFSSFLFFISSSFLHSSIYFFYLFLLSFPFFFFFFLFLLLLLLISSSSYFFFLLFLLLFLLRTMWKKKKKEEDRWNKQKYSLYLKHCLYQNLLRDTSNSIIFLHFSSSFLFISSNNVEEEGKINKNIYYF